MSEHGGVGLIDGSPVPHVSARDMVKVTGDVLAPTVAKGVILRRRWAMSAAERLDVDRRAVFRMQELRDRYGEGPLLLRTPRRPHALVLSPRDVHRVLEGSPEPFAVATREKRGALAQFEPHGVLVSDGVPRRIRRRFNEQALDTDRPMHELASSIAVKVSVESVDLSLDVDRAGTLEWELFARSWWRTVRWIVLGDAAREDEKVTDLLADLRAAANWSYLRPIRRSTRDRFERRLRGHLSRAEPDSVAGQVRASAGDASQLQHQVPQWLFAFDAAGMTLFRTLALIATHPDHRAQALGEIGAADLTREQTLPFLRACVLDTLRLWSTTPVILRETTTATRWQAGVLPAGTGLIIYAPYFHRDNTQLTFADRFAPDLWQDDRAAVDWPLVPFGGGPAMCPGRNLVLLVASMTLALLLSRHALHLHRPTRLDPTRPLPSTLDPFTLSFAASTAWVGVPTGQQDPPQGRS